MCSRVDKLSNYLVGDGLRSKIPHSDLWFYRLAGQCSHHSWPVRPNNWKPGTNLVTDIEVTNYMEDDNNGESPKDLKNDMRCDTRNSDFTRLFRYYPQRF